MAAVSVQKPPLTDTAQGPAGNLLPELHEQEYMSHVLQLSTDNFESYLESLINRATNLGISLSRPSPVVATPDKSDTLGTDSSATLDTTHIRTAMMGSEDSASTAPTSPTSPSLPSSPALPSSKDATFELTGRFLSRKRPKVPTFIQYENYLIEIDPDFKRSKFTSVSSLEMDYTASIFSASTRRSLFSIRNGLSKIRRKRRSMPPHQELLISCSACREDFTPDESIFKVPCGHSYCATCLRIMVNQATTDETKMPPRCCTQPIPSPTIRLVLPREEQANFLKAVLQFSTPWEKRVFCSNPECGEFIPPRNNVDPKHPLEASCRKCRTRVCLTCKGAAHPLGQDCPEDWELDTVLKMGEKSGWRRCYKCRTLVELTQGCTHMTCRCRAQFCYICGAVWDPLVGCPNFCNGEVEMERRRRDEEARIAALEAEEAAKQEQADRDARAIIEAEERTQKSEKFQLLRREQANEMERFYVFERKSRWLMYTRHAQQKLALVEKQSAAVDKMRDRHAKTIANLEDRQVAAEMELRATLEQSEKNVRIRLKHMEAYCLGPQIGEDMPSRNVTERDLRELDQQYAVEKNMKQLHQAKINVMRDRQAKALEELQERQADEMERATTKNRKEVEHLESIFSDEEDILAVTFSQRKEQLTTQWELRIQIRRKQLENETGLKHALLDPPQWPQEMDSTDYSPLAMDGGTGIGINFTWS